MDVKIINVYNDKALPDKGLKGGHGQSFHITIGAQQVLFDVGWKGRTFLHNTSKLRISVDEIDKLVFSHGHRDHTRALPAFLRARTFSTAIPAFGHPDVLEPKSRRRYRSVGRRRILFHHPIGFPKLDKKLKQKISFHWRREPVEITPKLSTTGEITDRPELEGKEKKLLHKVKNDLWQWDPIMDDLSLILQTKNGLVIITGCCHAGVLNTCAKARQLFNDEIKAIIGGTHMRNFTKEQVEHVGKVLETKYEMPELHLNHCTGDKVIDQLRERFGSERVHDCYVGTELIFQC